MRLAIACLLPLVAAAQSPTCEIGMVVRAGALNYDAKIMEFDAAKGLYKVQYVTGYKGDIEWLPPRGLKTCQAPEIAPVAAAWFQGVWQLNVGGGGAWQKNPSTGSWKVVGLDVAGAPPIRIAADGSYEWVINDAQTIHGRWRMAAQGDLKYGYDKKGTVLLLEQGESGKNWLVTRELTGTSDGRDRILIERVDLGTTYRGNRVGAATSAAKDTALTKANATLVYNPAKWNTTATADGFRLVGKDEKGFAILMTDPDQHSPTSFADTMLANMRRGDPNLKVTAQQQRTVNGTPAVLMRLEATVSGSRYSYMTVCEGNATGGVALITFSSPGEFPAHEADFVALINSLRLN